MTVPSHALSSAHAKNVDALNLCKAIKPAFRSFDGRCAQGLDPNGTRPRRRHDASKLDNPYTNNNNIVMVQIAIIIPSINIR